MSYSDVPIGRINNVNKSCKFIEGNPPYCSRVKVSTVLVPQGYQTLPEKSALVSYCQVKNQYKQRVSLFIYHTFIHTQLQHITERERRSWEKRERDCCYGEIISLSLGFTFGADCIFEEVARFSPLWFPEENICVHCLMWLIVVLVILSDKILRSYILHVKNLTIQEYHIIQ